MTVVQEFERIKSLVMRRLQSAGADGISANDFAPMIHADFPARSRDACRNVLIRMANDGKIFRKAVSLPQGGLQSHYFLTQEWCDGYVKNMLPSRMLGNEGASAVATIPKYSVTERDPQPFEFGEGIIVPAHVKVKVCDPYKSDYRITVDPASIPRHVDSSQCRDWAKA